MSGLKIVHISDIHLKRLGYREKKLVQSINSLSPDLVLVTGDYTAYGDDFHPVLGLFARVKSKYGIFGVLGNSDYTDGRGMCLLCHRAGSKKLNPGLPIKVLRNSHVLLKTPQGSVYIGGVDDPVNGRDDIDQALDAVSEGAFVILLSHSPDVVRKAAGKKIDLILCGHTHGGQLGLPFITSLHTGRALYERYRSGLFKLGATYLYVNRGIGTSYVPVRFFCRPELTVFSFEGQS